MGKGLRTILTKEDLNRLYLEERRSLEDIARLYGASRVAVWKYCKDEHLTIRNRSEARLEAQKSGKVPQNYFDINECFFSNWSREMAYVLGLIATDGCISRSGTVALCINDRELLQKVKILMGSAHNIKYYGHQDGLYNFSFSRQKLVSDLNKLGVFPNKSLTIRFPDVPDAFLIDFIRGVFDGDGSVFFDKRSENYPIRTKFVSSSKEFIKKLELALRKFGMPERIIYEQPTKNAISYMFKYGHKDSEKLFAAMYKDAQNGLFLERKYKKFLDGFNKKGIEVPIDK